MATRRSWIRWIDESLIAPHASAGERLLGYGAGVAGAAVAVGLAITSGLPAWATIVLALVGFDLFGGVVVNATVSGSRRFHGPSAPRWGALWFVAAHVHPLLLALLLPAMPWSTAVAAYAGIVLATVLTIVAPQRLREPVAFAFAGVLLTAATAVLPPEPVVAWVVPLLVLKLLLAHLLPHVPRTAATADQATADQASGS